MDCPDCRRVTAAIATFQPMEGRGSSRAPMSDTLCVGCLPYRAGDLTKGNPVNQQRDDDRTEQHKHHHIDVVQPV